MYYNFALLLFIVLTNHEVNVSDVMLNVQGTDSLNYFFL